MCQFFNARTRQYDQCPSVSKDDGSAFVGREMLQKLMVCLPTTAVFLCKNEDLVNTMQIICTVWGTFSTSCYFFKVCAHYIKYTLLSTIFIQNPE
jgi:hypothetical protein